MRWLQILCLAVATGRGHSILTSGCTIVLVACLRALVSDAAAAEPVATDAGPMEEVVVVASKIPRPLHVVPAQVTVVTADQLEFQQGRQW